MVGCKDDDTCDQPATKGEIETLQSYVVWGLVSIFTLVWINNSKISRVKSNTDEIHQYGTIGAPNLGAMRDKHGAPELEGKRRASLIIVSSIAGSCDR